MSEWSGGWKGPDGNTLKKKKRFLMDEEDRKRWNGLNFTHASDKRQPFASLPVLANVRREWVPFAGFEMFSLKSLFFLLRACTVYN